MRHLLQIFIILSVSLLYECKNRAIDLSYGYDESTVNYPGAAPFRWTEKRIRDPPNGQFKSSNDFGTGEHCGTHIDAPYHFKKDGTTVDKIELHKFLVTGILINATTETGTNSSYLLPASKLIEWERLNGEIPNNSVVFINFGWGKKFYPDRKSYLGPSDDDLQFPAVSVEAAQWIADTKRVVGIGVDTASPDISKRGDVHVMLSNSDMYILENLNISEPLPPKFRVIALPMKLIGGSGAPVRVIAFV